MYQSIDEIDVGDYSYDSVCLNCISWIINGDGSGGRICARGKGVTDPDYSCCLFTALKSMDDEYNSYSNKSQKIEIWRSRFG